MLDDYTKYLIPNEFKRKVLLDFIAATIQNPDKKIKWMPVIFGGQRVGKSLLVNAIAKGLNHSVGFVNTYRLNKCFNAELVDSKLLVLDGIDHVDLRNDVNLFLTEPNLVINRKGQEPETVVNITSMMAVTNDLPHHLRIAYKRYAVIETTYTPESGNYFAEFAEWLEYNKADIQSYFLERSIPDFNFERATLG